MVNAQYDLPFGKHLKGRMQKALIGGWALSGIWQFGSGLPFSANDGFNNAANNDPQVPDRPNLNPGFSNSPTTGRNHCWLRGYPGRQQPLGTATRWFDPCAFSLSPAGTYGNVGRLTINGPRFDQLNFTAAKTFAFTERIKLQFRAEFLQSG